MKAYDFLGLASAGCIMLGILLFSSLTWPLPFALWSSGFIGVCVASYWRGVVEP